MSVIACLPLDDVQPSATITGQATTKKQPLAFFHLFVVARYNGCLRRRSDDCRCALSRFPWQPGVLDRQISEDILGRIEGSSPVAQELHQTHVHE